jgi:outer membrane immunogenic protein
MRKKVQIIALLSAVAALLLNPSGALAQASDHLELGASYIGVRTNAPPGGCGCFFMNGGAGWIAYKLGAGVAVVGELGSSYASNIDATTASLTLTSFMGGPRYSWRHGKLAPFGQVLLGGAHASGGLTPDSAGKDGSSNAFAMAAGAGLDIELTRRFSLRAVQADYLLTRFTNSLNDHQNNFRIGAGIVFRFH